MQNKRIADNICAFFFFFWEIRTKNLTKTKFIVEPSFFTSWTIRSEKCSRAQLQENKSIYLSIYLSIWKPFWKRVYIYIYIYIYICMYMILPLSFSSSSSSSLHLRKSFPTTSSAESSNRFVSLLNTTRQHLNRIGPRVFSLVAIFGGISIVWHVSFTPGGFTSASPSIFKTNVQMSR